MVLGLNRGSGFRTRQSSGRTSHRTSTTCGTRGTNPPRPHWPLQPTLRARARMCAMWMCVCVCVYARACVGGYFACMHACMHARMYVCMHVCHPSIHPPIIYQHGSMHDAPDARDRRRDKRELVLRCERVVGLLPANVVVPSTRQTTVRVPAGGVPRRATFRAKRI